MGTLQPAGLAAPPHPHPDSYTCRALPLQYPGVAVPSWLPAGCWAVWLPALAPSTALAPSSSRPLVPSTRQPLMLSSSGFPSSDSVLSPLAPSQRCPGLLRPPAAPSSSSRGFRVPHRLPRSPLRSWSGEGQQGAQAAGWFFPRASSQCSQFGGSPGLLHPSAAPSSSTLGFCGHHGTLKSRLRSWSREGWLGARVGFGVGFGVAIGVAMGASERLKRTQRAQTALSRSPGAVTGAGTGLGDSTEGTGLGGGHRHSWERGENRCEAPPKPTAAHPCCIPTSARASP